MVKGPAYAKDDGKRFLLNRPHTKTVNCNTILDNGHVLISLCRPRYHKFISNIEI